MELTVKLDEAKILHKVTNDKFGKFVALSWKNIIDPYTPKDNGLLMQNVSIMPNKIHYKSPYAHYMYEGIVFVDPEYGVGAFYSSDYGFWSRKDVKKVPSNPERNFDYQKNNPYATDHWDKAAENAGKKEDLYKTLNRALFYGNY